jgi:hypothetical protein
MIARPSAVRESRPKQLRYFLDINNQLRLGQARLQARILAAQLGQFLG